MRTLHEREWVRVLSHRDVPGRPALYGITRKFLDDFGLKSVEDLPPLDRIRDVRPADLFPAGDLGASNGPSKKALGLVEVGGPEGEAGDADPPGDTPAGGEAGSDEG